MPNNPQTDTPKKQTPASLTTQDAFEYTEQDTEAYRQAQEAWDVYQYQKKQKAKNKKINPVLSIILLVFLAILGFSLLKLIFASTLLSNSLDRINLRQNTTQDAQN